MDLKGKEGYLHRLSSYLLSALTVLLALFTVYVVIGGIWTGQISILTDTHPIVQLALFALLILLIGGLEGLQISVSNLQKKDLAEISDDYPGAARLHEIFKDKDDVAKRFFGGRQFLIVALVFIASRLSSFPEMQRLPFIDASFPDIVTPWFQFLFLDLGLLGALFVLWLGNLTAQFVATDHPVEFLNMPGMALLFSLCLWIDKIRLPRPAMWLSTYFSGKIAGNPAKAHDRRRPGQSGMLPVSSEERWRREVESESGFALTNTTREWRLYEDRIGLTYRSTYLIGRDGIETIVDNNFLIPSHLRLGSQNSFSWNAYITGPVEEPTEETDQPSLARLFRRLFHPEEEREADDEPEKAYDISFDKYKRTVYQDEVPFDNYVLSFSNRKGSFEPGVKIRAEVEAELDASPAEFTGDRFLIDHPCAEIELRVEFRGDFDTINCPHLHVSNPIHEQTPGSENSSCNRLQVHSTRDGSAFSTYSEEYPRVRSRYEVLWDVTPSPG